MENSDPLWIQVEMALASWCWSVELSCIQLELEHECTCPSQAQLRESPPEALRRLLSALGTKTYTGAWKDYLGT